MNAKKKNYIVASVFILLFLIVFLLAIPFFMGKIASTSADFVKNKQALAGLQNAEYNAAMTERDYQKLKPDLDRLNQSLLNREQILDFISVLKMTAQKTGVNSDIKIIDQKANNKNEFGAVGFQVSVTGSFPDFIRFLKGLEAMPYFFSINNIQIQQAGKKINEQGIESSNISANFGLQIYLQP